MNNNKNQHVSNVANEEFAVTSTNTLASSHTAKVIPLNNRYEPAKHSLLQIMEENTKIIRRHSFDDNGGGYEGL